MSLSCRGVRLVESVKVIILFFQHLFPRLSDHCNVTNLGWTRMKVERQVFQATMAGAYHTVATSALCRAFATGEVAVPEWHFEEIVATRSDKWSKRKVRTWKRSEHDSCCREHPMISATAAGPIKQRLGLAYIICAAFTRA